MTHRKTYTVSATPWYASKTFRVNLLIIILAAVDGIAGSPVLDSTGADFMALLSGVLNLILRSVTRSPLSFQKK